MDNNMPVFVLLFQCKDQKGIVAQVSDFIFRHNGNIINADQHSTGLRGGNFFMRAEFLIEKKGADKKGLEAALGSVAKEFGAEYKIYDKHKKLRMGILASKPGHCLFDLLYLCEAGELEVEIPFVISDYEGHRDLVQQYKIPFHYIAAEKKDTREKELLRIASGSEFLVLARYMLVLSKDFLASYAKDIINIHHGFLPSFKGAKPYRQALEQGVKVIGATAHFVTDKLDEGPIIAQKVEAVSHSDDLASLVRKGKNLEKWALSSALHSYVDYRVIRHGRTAIVF